MEPVSWLPGYFSYPLYWIYLNQSLIAGILALVAAYFTIKVIRGQIDQAQRSEVERFKRRNRAARASLPFALSEFVDYANNCRSNIIVVELAVQNSLPLTSAVTLPSYPALAAAKIADAIETADADNSKKLASILAYAQIYHARLTEFVELSNRSPIPVSKRDCNNRYYDTLCLKKLCARAFEYGRGEVEAIGAVCTSTEAIAELRVSWGFMNPDLEQIVRERWPPDFHDYAEALADW